jgi:hypothetical protein
MWRPLVIYDFAPDPIWISLYMWEKKKFNVVKSFFIESMWPLIIGACYYKNERKKLSRPTYRIAILLWRKYIWIREWNVNKPANRLYIYAVQFSSYLAMLVWKLNMRLTSHPPTFFILKQNYWFLASSRFKLKIIKNPVVYDQTKAAFQTVLLRLINLARRAL